MGFLLLLLLLVVHWLAVMLMFPYEVWSCPSVLPSSGATLVMCEESGFLRWNLLLVKMLWRLLNGNMGFTLLSAATRVPPISERHIPSFLLSKVKYPQMI